MSVPDENDQEPEACPSCWGVGYYLLDDEIDEAGERTKIACRQCKVPANERV